MGDATGRGGLCEQVDFQEANAAGGGAIRWMWAIRLVNGANWHVMGTMQWIGGHWVGW